MLRQAIIFQDYLVLVTPSRVVPEYFLKINLDIKKTLRSELLWVFTHRVVIIRY